MARRILVNIVLITFLLVQPRWADSHSKGGRMIGGIFVYKDEPECISEGGLCVKANNCLQLHPKCGLCPLNANAGVECCFRTTVKPAPCRQHLGECMKQCNVRIQRPATDCPESQVCCVLV